MTTESVDVCICTYKRASLEGCLNSILSQNLPEDVTLQIIVIDNDFERGAEPIVRQAQTFSGVPIIYRVEPKKNISAARNAGLGACKAKWMAFIDDDETAPPDWLAQLWASSGNTDCVFGPSKAVYQDAPHWMVQGDFHTNILTQRTLPFGHTCNVLLDRSFVEKHALSFDQSFGETGGEDNDFFARMGLCGARFALNPAAVVYEVVTPERATLRWLIRRRFRSGQCYAAVREKLRGGMINRLRLGSIAFGKAVLFLLAAAVSVSSRKLSCSFLLRSALQIGVLSRAMGRPVLKEYK